MHRAWNLVELRRAQRERTARAALAIASLACLALAGARLIYSFSITTPLQLTTSGAEAEALASIWRFIHGQSVYTDPRVIPYTASYFNWFFYLVYGTVAGGVLRLLGLSDAWLPTFCRLITLAFAALGAAILASILRQATDGRTSRVAALMLGALAFFNPLCGFWMVTTRPDMGAAVLELGAVAMFLRYRQSERRSDLVAVAVCLQAAWAFKETSIGALVGIGLAMLFLPGRLRRPEVNGYQKVWSLGASFGLGVIVAYTGLGRIYRQGLYLSQIHSGFHLSWALFHFGSAVLKMPFIAVALGGAALTWRRGDDALRVVALVLAATFLLELAASSKGGAGDYYFLSLGVWSVLWIALALDRFPSRAMQRAVFAAALLEVGAVLVVLAGQRGTLDPCDPAEPYEHLARSLAARPGPVFVSDTYGDLPWISPTAPHFVIASNNQVDALAGVTFQDGNWKGLLAHGYFATVVIWARSPKVPDVSLSRYRFIREESGWCYYERR